MVIKSIVKYLKKNGVEIFTRKTVVDINPREKKIKTKDGKEYGYEYLIIGVGRGGSKWL